MRRSAAAAAAARFALVPWVAVEAAEAFFSARHRNDHRVSGEGLFPQRVTLKEQTKHFTAAAFILPFDIGRRRSIENTHS